MKVKFAISHSFFVFLTIGFGYSQNDTLNGKIISSVSIKKPKGDIYIFEKGTNNGVVANKQGVFKLIPETKKENYLLEISVGNYPNFIYNYKSLFSKYKNPKSIVIKGDCLINKKKAKKDWKNGTPKLYINSGITPIVNTNKDKRFEKKYNIQYVEISCETKIYECVSEYNFYIIKILDIEYQSEWRKTKREEIVGMNDYLNSIKACLN